MATPIFTPEQVAARRKRLVLAVVGIAGLIALPQTPLFASEFRAFIFGIALCSGLMGLSINVLTGYAGQISLGHAALWGTGAFATAHLMALRGLPFWIALPLGAAITGIVVLIVGFPALRVRGLHLAIVTLGFQFLMNRIVFRLTPITGGAAGIDVERPAFLGYQLDLDRDFLYVIFVVVIAVLWVDRNLTRTRAGRAFFAIREDERVASSFGIDVARYKLLAFVVSGVYAGLSGGLFGVLVGQVVDVPFDYPPSLEFLAFAVIGGLGSRPGTMVGAMFPVVYRQAFQGLRSWGVALGGFLLIITLVRYRGGLAEQGRELRHLGSLLWHGRRRIARAVIGLPATLWRRRRAIGWALTHPPAWLEARRRRRAEAAASVPAPSAEDAGLDVGFRWAGGAPTVNGEIKLGTRRGTRRRTSGPLLEVSDVAIRFGGVQALGGVSLEAREGEIVGIMGPNGAGKTTLFNCISGYAKPDSGNLTFQGREILDLPPHERSVMGIGRTFQNIGLVKSETVLDNFLIAQHAVAGYGPVEGMLRTAAVQRSEQVLRHRSERVIDLLGLTSAATSKVADLPHGLLKMVELGCALVTGPELLLLDEPSSGMAPQEAEDLGSALRHVRDTFGVSILLIEHHVPLVLEVADYVYVLNFGKLLAEGEASAIADHPEVIRAYIGGTDDDLIGAVDDDLEFRPT